MIMFFRCIDNKVVVFVSFSMFDKQIKVCLPKVYMQSDNGVFIEEMGQLIHYRSTSYRFSVINKSV